MNIDIGEIKKHAIKHFKLETCSIHGEDHWERVYRYGMAVARRNGADAIVVTLFAFLHDACRRDDGADLEHGKRSAELVMKMQGKIFSITDTQLISLAEACRHHTDGKCSDDPTIGTCWDADRLDLGRVGIIP
ncbi:MAG: hypothetical protein WC637_22015, partial [Victivallales bacterium]